MLIKLVSCTGPETLYFQKFECKKDKSAKGEKNSVTKLLDSLKGFNSSERTKQMEEILNF